LREWITTDCRNTPLTTNPEDEEFVDAPGNDGNASMPEQVKRSNPWMMMMMSFLHLLLLFIGNIHGSLCVVRTGSKTLQQPGQRKKQWKIVRRGVEGVRGQYSAFHPVSPPEKVNP